MIDTGLTNSCDVCSGNGYWPDLSGPMGALDSMDGLPTAPCPQCGANPVPKLAGGVPPKPQWAHRVGHDRYGAWATLGIDDQTINFRYIKAGKFIMGATAEEIEEAMRLGNEPEGSTLDQGQRLTSIDTDFWLADCACTQGVWQTVMGANPSRFQGHGARPVEMVSWNDVQKFFIRLYRKLGTGLFHLPTEHLWEYACRSGTTTWTYEGDLESHDEMCSPTLDAIAWYAGNCDIGRVGKNGIELNSAGNSENHPPQGGTWPVKLRNPNPWGLYDMIGNVWEWCSDPHANIPQSTTDAHFPLSKLHSPGRYLRGGSWRSPYWNCRASSRVWFDQDFRYDNIGFRLCSVMTSSSL